MPVAAEPATVYRKMEGNDERIISTFHSHEANGNTAGRMSVDEYFDELWSMYLKKRENLRAWVSHNKRWVYIFHIENDTVVIDRIKAAKLIKR